MAKKKLSKNVRRAWFIHQLIDGVINWGVFFVLVLGLGLWAKAFNIDVAIVYIVGALGLLWYGFVIKK